MRYIQRPQGETLDHKKTQATTGGTGQGAASDVQIRQVAHLGQFADQRVDVVIEHDRAHQVEICQFARLRTNQSSKDPGECLPTVVVSKCQSFKVRVHEH